MLDRNEVGFGWLLEVVELHFSHTRWLWVIWNPRACQIDSVLPLFRCKSYSRTVWMKTAFAGIRYNEKCILGISAPWRVFLLWDFQAFCGLVLNFTRRFLRKKLFVDWNCYSTGNEDISGSVRRVRILRKRGVLKTKLTRTNAVVAGVAGHSCLCLILLLNSL